MTVGKLKDVKPFPRGDGVWVYYSFLDAKNKIQEGRSRVFVEHKYSNNLCLLLTGKPLPVIYDSMQEDNNKVLLTKKDFAEFNCTVPDTLNTVINYIESIKF